MINERLKLQAKWIQEQHNKDG